MSGIEDKQIQGYRKGLELSIHDKKMANKQIELVGEGNFVLDLGCCDGQTTEKIARKNKVIGLELSEEAAELGRKKRGLDIQVGRVQSIPFEDNTFDVVHFSEVIEHIVDTDKALQDIKRVLKPDGRLIVTTPNFCSIRDRILVFFGKLQAHACHEEHVKFFNLNRLRKYLVNNGYRIKSIQGSGFVIPIPSHSIYIFKLDGLLPPTWMQRLIVEAKVIK